MCSAFERRVFFAKECLSRQKIETLDVYFVQIGNNALIPFLSQISERKKKTSPSHGNKRYLKLSIILIFIDYVQDSISLHSSSISAPCRSVTYLPI